MSGLVGWAWRLLLGFAAFYVALLIALWALQGQLLYPAPQAQPEAPEGFAEIELLASDGIKTRAFYRQAQSGLPTVLFYHGNGETLSGSLAGTRLLTERGYGALLPEYRGYGGQAGEPSEEGFYADGRAALTWLKGEGIDADQTVIAGHSIGTGTAVQMANELQPAALMLSAPFRSLTSLVGEKFPWVPAGLLLRDRYESESKLDEFAVPTLIVHGEQDTLIPPSHGRALNASTLNSTILMFDALGHNNMYHDDVLAQQISWLESRGLGR